MNSSFVHRDARRQLKKHGKRDDAKALLAQLVARRTSNPEAVGSSPTWSVQIFTIVHDFFFAICGDRLFVLLVVLALVVRARSSKC